MNLTLVAAALNKKLNITSFNDYSNNGLQVESCGRDIRCVCTGVDASLQFFEAAAANGADLVICHHGISWGDSLKQITGLNYRQIRFLIEHNIALWACHLPLDAHPDLGNNAQIARSLGVRNCKPFGEYHGQTIGFAGELPNPVTRDVFVSLVHDKIGANVQVQPFGPEFIRTVGIVSGGAADFVDQVDVAGLDVYVTGEINLQAYNAAQQLGVNMISAGHYATERFGVKAVGEWLASEYGLEHHFIDFDLKY